MRGLCPSCGGTTTQKAGAIYSSGTNYTSGSVSLTHYQQGGQGVAFTTGSTSGLTQSKLAEKCAPPNKARGLLVLFLSVFVVILLISVLVWVVLAVVYSQQSNAGNTEPGYKLFVDGVARQLAQFAGTTILSAHDAEILERAENHAARYFLLCLCISIGGALLSTPFGIRNTLWNWTVYQRLSREYQITWYCHRCHDFFLER